MRIYNSLTRKVEKFIPLEKGKVKMYTCGPTVYDHAHIGHGRTYVIWDILKKWFKYKGFDVYHVMNITDVGHLVSDRDFGEDKIIKRALEKQMEPMVLVEKMIRSWLEDFDNLVIVRPDLMPRATFHIPEIIEVVKLILKNGYAYEVNGSVYFDIQKYMKKYPYPEFIDISFEELQKTERISEEIAKEKKNPLDFALWKKATPGHILQWPSPWGYGYPGWHIECTVMGVKYLGEEFDIHGGGEDHKFPHHPNERAQAFAAFGKGLARYWMHVGFVTLEGEKMSKSAGNFIYLKDALKKWGKSTFRFWVASTHYRKQVDFSEEALESAKKGYESLLLFMQDLLEAIEKDGKGKLELPFTKKFEESMDNDLKTNEALASIFELKEEFYSKNLFNASPSELRKVYEKIVEYGKILGIDLDVDREKYKILSKKTKEIIKIILEIREELRKEKNYKLSDEIRKKLREIGIQIFDTKEGPKIRILENL